MFWLYMRCVNVGWARRCSCFHLRMVRRSKYGYQVQVLEIALGSSIPRMLYFRGISVLFCPPFLNSLREHKNLNVIFYLHGTCSLINEIFHSPLSFKSEYSNAKPEYICGISDMTNLCLEFYNGEEREQWCLSLFYGWSKWYRRSRRRNNQKLLQDDHGR